jgi:integrase
VRVSRTLPIILSREEVSRLLEAAKNLKHRTALSVAYGAGLRVSEVTALKVGDIDSQRMLLRIEQGKGAKDRYALLPPLLLERLRIWWRFARAQGKVLSGGYEAAEMGRSLETALHCSSQVTGTLSAPIVARPHSVAKGIELSRRG